MRRVFINTLYFLLGGVAFMVGAVLAVPAQAVQVPSTPTSQPSPTAAPTSTPASTQQPTSLPTPTQQAAAGARCYDCSPIKARVKLSHYSPQEYNQLYPQLNCYKYSEEHKWCLSPTWIGVPWESVYQIGAACPDVWAVGTWVDVPGVGAFICFDHGEDITCDPNNGVCKVDILGTGGSWDQQTYDVTLWVPKSWLIRYTEKEKQ